MKHLPSKADVREEIEEQIKEFLDRGGQVNQVRPGTSGLNDGEPPPNLAFDRPKQERTPIPEVVAAIDARREASKKTKKPSGKLRKRPRKQVIYDDFGEPVRIIWIDE